MTAVSCGEQACSATVATILLMIGAETAAAGDAAPPPDCEEPGDPTEEDASGRTDVGDEEPDATVAALAAIAARGASAPAVRAGAAAVAPTLTPTPTPVSASACV